MIQKFRFREGMKKKEGKKREMKGIIKITTKFIYSFCDYFLLYPIK